MRKSRTNSVEKKLRAIVMITSGAALLFVVIGVAVVDLISFRGQMAENLATQADLLTESSAVALTFDQEEDGAKVLTRLGANPRVDAARLFDATGKVFASFESGDSGGGLPSRAPEPGVRFGTDRFEVVREIRDEDRVLGWIWIRSDLATFYARFGGYLGLTPVLVLGAFVSASLLGSRLARAVTRPIVQLSERMALVSKNGDYSVRVESSSDDEIGDLMDGFNGMLEQLGEHDAALKAESEQLTERVEERTARLRQANQDLVLTNQRLHLAMSEAELLAQAAEAASRAKSDFLATVSHELRTPMNGVIGFTNLLLDTSLKPEQRDFAQIIRNSGQTLLALINDILDFSKIEAGKLTVESLPMDLRAAVEEVSELIGPRADEKGLDLALGFDASLPETVSSDPSRVRQILMNLVGNAVKFTEHGHILVEAGLAESVAAHFPGVPATGGKSAVMVCVSDTGIGIPIEKQSWLFDKFTQADSSTTRKYGGTGLGLAISKRLAELLGGSMGFVSEVGKGSTFWFTLPMAQDAPTAKAAAALPDLAGLRVLVVDDQEVNRRVLREQLQVWRVDHDCVGSGAEALDRLKAAREAGAPYHVALLDYLMPQMDGRELGRRIREEPANQGLRLILITSGSMRGDAEDLVEAGFAACLFKPLVRPRQLLEALAQGWTAASAWNPTSTSTSTPTPPPTSTSTSTSTADDVDGTARLAGGGVGRGFGAGVDGVGERVEGEGSAGFATGRTGDRDDGSGGGEVPPARVLLAEDNPTNQLYAKRLLEKLGLQVEIASNGREACEWCRETEFDVILMDCQMPEMSGYDAVAEIRAWRGGGTKRVPIVALTAHAMAGERERCLAAGMDDYLAKPFRKDELERVLCRWLPGRVMVPSSAGAR